MAAAEEQFDGNDKRVEQDEAAKSAGGSEDIAGQGIAAGEVKAVSVAPERKSSSRSLLLLLLLVVLAAAGYYLYGDQLLNSKSSVPLAGQQPKPQLKRYTIERQIVAAKVATPAVESASDEKSPGVAVSQPGNEAPTAKTSPPAAQLAASDLPLESLSSSQGSPDVPHTALATAEKTAVEPSTAKDGQTEPVKQLIEKTADTTVDKGSPVAVEDSAFRVLVGPYLTRKNLTEADRQLRELGYVVAVGEGRGPVFLTRLIEGIYSRSQAKQRVQELRKQLGDAFLLPSAGEWAVCVGSFVDPDRATQYGKELAQKNISITTVSQDVEINGKMLIIEQKGKPAAERLAARLKAAGYRVAVKDQ